MLNKIKGIRSCICIKNKWHLYSSGCICCEVYANFGSLSGNCACTLVLNQ